MQHERVVELTFGRRSQGSGYLVTTRHVLTARHVVPPNGVVGKPCHVRPLLGRPSGTTHAAARGPDPVAGHVAWLPTKASGLDIAVITLDAPLAVPGEAVSWARIAHGDPTPHEFIGTGFPAAAGAESHPFFGKLTDVPPGRLDLHVGSALPGDWTEWAGASGTVVFCEGHAVGVVSSVSGHWTGKLSATPLHRLLSDEGFVNWYADQNELPPKLHTLGAPRESALEIIAAKLHQLDRTDIVLAARRRLEAMAKPATTYVAPQLLVVAGVEQDWHHKLIQQLAESMEVQRLLGREADAQDVIIQLHWPAQDRVEEPVEALSRMLEPLYEAAHLPAPSAVELTDPAQLQAVSERLDDGVSPRSYWTLLRRRQAHGGHGALLRQLLSFWAGLRTHRPLFLFLCLALDEPAAPRKPLLRFLAPAVAQPETDLTDVIEQALAAMESQCVSLPQLDAIAPRHIPPWINELKRSGRGLTQAQLELFGASLQTRMGEEGMRLQPLSACLGELLFSTLHGTARGASP